MFTRFVAVLVGGMLGSATRFALDTLIPQPTLGSLSIATAIANVLGSFALGFLTARVWRSDESPDWVKVGLGPGFLGSFTTLSAVSLNVVTALNEGRWIDAALAIAFSLGLLAAWSGLRLGEKPRRPGSSLLQGSP